MAQESEQTAADGRAAWVETLTRVGASGKDPMRPRLQYGSCSSDGSSTIIKKVKVVENNGNLYRANGNAKEVMNTGIQF